MAQKHCRDPCLLQFTFLAWKHHLYHWGFKSVWGWFVDRHLTLDSISLNLGTVDMYWMNHWHWSRLVDFPKATLLPLLLRYSLPGACCLWGEHIPRSDPIFKDIPLQCIHPTSAFVFRAGTGKCFLSHLPPRRAKSGPFPLARIELSLNLSWVFSQSTSHSCECMHICALALTYNNSWFSLFKNSLIRKSFW